MSSPVNSAFGANNLSARTDLQQIVARVVRANQAPTAKDKLFAVGTTWIDGSAARAYILVGIDNGNANWQQCAGA